MNVGIVGHTAAPRRVTMKAETVGTGEYYTLTCPGQVSYGRITSAMLARAIEGLDVLEDYLLSDEDADRADIVDTREMATVLRCAISQEGGIR